MLINLERNRRQNTALTLTCILRLCPGDIGITEVVAMTSGPKLQCDISKL